MGHDDRSRDLAAPRAVPGQQGRDPGTGQPLEAGITRG